MDALIRQSFSPDEFEIIVVTDGPDEVTVKALAAYTRVKAPAVKCYSLSKQKGPAAARNFGWRMSRSRLIAFTDDDCVPDAYWLMGFWNAFLRTPGSKMAFTGKTIVPIPTIPTDYERSIADLASAEFITANCACSKLALERVGGFDEQFTMAWREDSDLQFKFLEQKIPIFQTLSAIVTHPVRKAPWGISLKEEKKRIFNALLYKKFPTLYKQKIQPVPPWHYYLILLSLLIGIVSALAGNSILAAVFLSVWLCITFWFTAKRLAHTSHTADHILEMVITSAVIPFLSVYWRIYGALKFKALLIP
jgi:glycosyltransferase involved in cell wall biosynthesis